MRFWGAKIWSQALGSEQVLAFNCLALIFYSMQSCSRVTIFYCAFFTVYLTLTSLCLCYFVTFNVAHESRPLNSLLPGSMAKGTTFCFCLLLFLLLLLVACFSIHPSWLFLIFIHFKFRILFFSPRLFPSKGKCQRLYPPSERRYGV